jgi:hypothetical protein
MSPTRATRGDWAGKQAKRRLCKTLQESLSHRSRTEFDSLLSIGVAIPSSLAIQVRPAK